MELLWYLRVKKIRTDYTDAVILVRVADVKHAPRISLNPHGIMPGTGRRKVKSAVIEVRNPPYVILSFRKMRDSRTPRHRARTCVIGGQSQIHVAAIVFQKLFEMPHSRIHVLLGIDRK